MIIRSSILEVIRMNHLVAKTSGKNSEIMKIMSTDEEIFSIPDISNTEPYSPSYMLEDEEWFVLDNFISRGYINELIGIRNNFNSTSYSQIRLNQYDKIEYLCSKQDVHFLFQKMSSTRLVRKKWFSISGAPRLEVDNPIIILNNSADAVYNISLDKLYFRKLETIKSMFKGIEELYREATQEEVDDFLKEEFISLEEGFVSTEIKTANRKRIAMAIDTLEKFTKEEKKQIISYIKEYCDDVPTKDGLFIVGSEEHLKKILYGIEQRYYTTPIGNEKRLATSILPIKHQNNEQNRGVE